MREDVRNRKSLLSLKYLNLIIVTPNHRKENGHNILPLML